MESDVPSGLHAKGGMRPGEADPLEPKRHSGKVHYRIVYKEVGDGLHSVELMSTVFEYLSEVIRGVAALYSRGFIHRDISIGNVLIVEGPERRRSSPTSPKQVKLSDLEYARPLADSQPVHGSRAGTVYFMSTEVAGHEYQHLPAAIDVDDKDIDPAWFTQSIRPSTPPARNAVNSRHPLFRHNGLHDAASAFWLGLYVLLTRILARRDGPTLIAHPDDQAYQRAQVNLFNRLLTESDTRVKVMQIPRLPQQ
ncbi:hypothetical protein C8Q70DRAFT_231106 [Cubamyces menziesii]|nr:hypothetical protein C8Q70DRAFT_231106 [Cubamyces menziesii]